MYWCSSCKEPVEAEFRRHKEWHDEVDTRRLEFWDVAVCPYCGEEVEEANQCACGEWIDPERNICMRCEEVAEDALVRAQEYIRTTVEGITYSQARDIFLEWIEENY